MRTMTMKGGNMAQLYQGDGRLTMARSLERMWPGVVSINRRFGRPQHVVKNSWRNFDTSLIRFLTSFKNAFFSISFSVSVSKDKNFS